MRKSYMMIITVLLAFIVASVGCSNPEGSEKALRQRVMQEWNAKVNGDWGVVYDLTFAEYRKKVSRSDFLRGSKIDVSEFSIKEIKILESGKEAVVSVESKLSQKGMVFPFAFQETWLLEDDGWRLKLTPVDIPGVEK